MDEAELERLAEHGLTSLFPVERLRTVAEYCWDRGETTGDARYCSLWRSLDKIIQVWELDRPLPTPMVRSIDTLLSRYLPDVLHAPSAEEGALLARRLREELLAVDPEDGPGPALTSE